MVEKSVPCAEYGAILLLWIYFVICNQTAPLGNVQRRDGEQLVVGKNSIGWVRVLNYQPTLGGEAVRMPVLEGQEPAEDALVFINLRRRGYCQKLFIHFFCFVIIIFIAIAGPFFVVVIKIKQPAKARLKRGVTSGFLGSLLSD